MPEPETKPERPGRLKYKVGNEKHETHSSWHRGDHCNFTPSQTNLKERGAIPRYILKGWLPEAPPIPARGNVLAVGSCFAMHIAAYLRKHRGGQLRVNDAQNVNLFVYGAGFVNTFTLRQQFEWSLGKKEIESATLYVDHRKKLNDRRTLHCCSLMSMDDKQREASRQAILDAEAFILTLGLSEVWFDRETGEVFFGAVPEHEHDPEKHGFRVSTVEENRQNIQAIVNLIRELKPEAPIIFTLSPVPLIATFRPVSCITANSVSKATLRVAVDDVMRANDDPNLYYWPSYEIVTEFYGVKDAYQADRRHIRRPVVDRIMRLFCRHFIEGGI